MYISFVDAGVSHNKCSETYCGPEAFSEPETKNIRDFVQTLDPVPVLGHCFHSYSQLWLWPYGYDYNVYPENRYGYVFQPIRLHILCSNPFRNVAADLLSNLSV